MSDRTETRERPAESDAQAPSERAMVVASKAPARTMLRFTGANMMGRGVKVFAYVSIVLGAIVSLPQFEGASTLSYALLVIGCLALAAIVSVIGGPWRITIGIDGVFVPRLMKGAVRWRDVRSISLGDAPRGSGFEYTTVDLEWANDARISLPAWSLTGDEARRIRDEIEARVAYSRGYAEPECIAPIQRASRPVAAWVEALRSATEQHFRQQNVDIVALLSAVQSGALSLLDTVNCAVAVAVLGTTEQRAALARLADLLVDERCASAVRAAAQQRFSDPSIDLATR